MDDNSKLSRRRILSLVGLGSLICAGGALFYRYFSANVAVKVASFSTEGEGRPKNILIITGSGRKEGNSARLAKAFADGAMASGHTVKIFQAADEPMSACFHCEQCWSKGKPCVVNDSFNKFYPLLEEAELLVFCSPLYWYNFSGHIKCVMDRMYPYSKKKSLKGS